MRTNRMITAVDVHAEGESGRVITGGMPRLIGDTVFAKMQYMQTHHDGIRTLMLQEPRGNPALCCNVLVEPCNPTADAAFIIMEQTEYPPMSGSNIICVTTVLLETGIIEMKEPVTKLRLESPAGLIDVTAACKDGNVERVEFLNVPGFAVHIDVPLDVPDYGTIQVDIAWGGMFFVLADSKQFNIDPIAENGANIVKACEAMRHASLEQLPVTHPENPYIKGPTISALTADPTNSSTQGRGAISVSTGPYIQGKVTGALDRSPCGTGTCAKMAVLYAKGLLAINENYVNAGPLGTTFTGKIVETTKIGKYEAIVPTLSGRAWITGISQYTLDPSDPFQTGFTVGDIWG